MTDDQPVARARHCGMDGPARLSRVERALHQRSIRMLRRKKIAKRSGGVVSERRPHRGTCEQQRAVLREKRDGVLEMLDARFESRLLAHAQLSTRAPPAPA